MNSKDISKTLHIKHKCSLQLLDYVFSFLLYKYSERSGFDKKNQVSVLTNTYKIPIFVQVCWFTSFSTVPHFILWTIGRYFQQIKLYLWIEKFSSRSFGVKAIEAIGFKATAAISSIAFYWIVCEDSVVYFRHPSDKGSCEMYENAFCLRRYQKTKLFLS